jgi:predicted nucleic acid-binding protein
MILPYFCDITVEGARATWSSTYRIDTNVASDYFSASLPKDSLRFLDSVMDAVPNLSVISQIELLCRKTDKRTEQSIQAFINDSNIFDITPEVIRLCVAIRKSRKIKTPDAIIAATALAHNFILITSNTKDFSNIKGLKILDPETV